MSTEIFKVNGITVANIKNDSENVFFGVAVLAGCNYETPEIAGISHFAEHLAFKGTKTRNWKQINESFAKLGVSNNAYTSNSEVIYFGTFPKDNTEKVIEITLDMFFNSTFPEEEMEKERNVILEEKHMYEDNPKYAFDNRIGENFFIWALGHDTIGTVDTIKSITREQVINYLKQKIDLANVLFVCSGNVDSNDLRQYIEKNVPSEHPYLRNSVGSHDLPNGLWTDIVNKPEKIKYLYERENIEQSTVYMMVQGLSNDDAMFHTSQVLYEALGGGMYSYLFSRIREELGLCYSVGISNMTISYPDKNIINTYGFTSPKNVDLFMEESEKIIRDVMKNGISQDIFECAKTDHLASTLRGTETSTGKAFYLVKRLLLKKSGSLEESLQKIRAIKIEDCNALAEAIFSKNWNWAVMSPKK